MSCIQNMAALMFIPAVTTTIIMHLLNKLCQFKAYKDDKSNFVFKSMLFAKFTQAHAAFGRGICHLL